MVKYLYISLNLSLVLVYYSLRASPPSCCSKNYEQDVSYYSAISILFVPSLTDITMTFCTPINKDKNKTSYVWINKLFVPNWRGKQKRSRSRSLVQHGCIPIELLMIMMISTQEELKKDFPLRHLLVVPLYRILPSWK